MSVMIGVVSDHAARYSWFNQCLADMDKPAEGHVFGWRFGGSHSSQRNMLVEDCLAQGCDWLFFIDDDHAFPKDTLTRLLSHQKPIVSALVLQRGAPFLPAAYAEEDDGRFYHLDLTSCGPDNLVQVRALGTGALLVHMSMLAQFPNPWFKYSDDLGEDLYFSNLLWNAGIPMLVDTGCRVGHIAPAAVFPAWTGNHWISVFRYADGTAVFRPLDHKEQQ